VTSARSPREGELFDADDHQHRAAVEAWHRTPGIDSRGADRVGPASRGRRTSPIRSVDERTQMTVCIQLPMLTAAPRGRPAERRVGERRPGPTPSHRLVAVTIASSTSSSTPDSISPSVPGASPPAAPPPRVGRPRSVVHRSSPDPSSPSAPVTLRACGGPRPGPTHGADRDAPGRTGDSGPTPGVRTYVRYHGPMTVLQSSLFTPAPNRHSVR